ncbi:MAG: tyrosine recombinase XerC [Candidatus Zixiibacteriota bacterium]
MRLSETIPQFTRQLAANGRSGHTQAAYERDLRAMGRWLGEGADISAITPDHLARFLISDMVHCTPDGRARAAISVNRTKSAIRSFFQFCVESGCLEQNPARLIRSSPATPKEPSCLETLEIEAIRAVLAGKTGTLADRARLIFELLLGTGIRLGSLVSLNITDVDLPQATLHIRSKGGHRERVFLNPGLVAMLARHLEQNATQGSTGRDVPLFASKSGRRLGARQIQLNFAKWCQEAGIGRGVSVHSLRHTFATRLYRKTGDLYLVQRALGHRQITTTEVYARVSDDSLRAAVSAI